MTDPTPPQDLVEEDAMPLVAGRSAGGGVLAWVLIGALGLGVFGWMSARRAAANQAPLTQPVRGAAVDSAAVPPLAMVATVQPAARAASPSAGPPIAMPSLGGDTAALDALARARAPVLVVDLGEAPGAAPPAAATAPPREDASDDAPDPALNDNERFEARVGGGDADRAHATRLHNLDRLIPQGAIISAVLETAINTDTPGFARAVVSRDVLGFDGTKVLIPRGSRLIGQYKSGVAIGQSRAFVIWTRVIRPDGVSVQIASPSGDDLGRGGLAGQVDNHFFIRFGGAILLSVLNAGISSLASAHNGAQIIIGSSADASSVAASALQKESAVSPTIKVDQGASVRVFVARDLDFSQVVAK